MTFCVDNWFAKVNPLMFKILGASSPEQQENVVDELTAMVSKEIEPLLHDAGPFFGGSKQMTLVEVRLCSSLRSIGVDKNRS